MGLFNNLFKAAKAIDKIAGDGELSRLADEARSSIFDAIGGNDNAPAASTEPTVKRTTPDIVMNSAGEPIAPYKIAEGWGFEEDEATGEDAEFKITYEIPEDFTEFNSHAEPTMCYMYKFEESDYEDLDYNKPNISIHPMFYKELEEFEANGTVQGSLMCEPVANMGKMFMRAKKRVDDSMVYFYGFKKGNANAPMSIAMYYQPDLVGTPLEQKLIAITDHAAQTYTEHR